MIIYAIVTYSTSTVSREKGRYLRKRKKIVERFSHIVWYYYHITHVCTNLPKKKHTRIFEKTY